MLLVFECFSIAVSLFHLGEGTGQGYGLSLLSLALLWGTEAQGRGMVCLSCGLEGRHGVGEYVAE